MRLKLSDLTGQEPTNRKQACCREIVGGVRKNTEVVAGVIGGSLASLGLESVQGGTRNPSQVLIAEVLSDSDDEVSSEDKLW